MAFFDNLQNAMQRDDEIVLFEASELGYYAYPRLGGRFDIMHAFNFQPPILNYDDYYSFMFVESLHGFFVFRQRVFENKEEPWRVFLELVPREPHCFFSDALSLHLKLRDVWASGNRAL
jgi:hypothetical protein